PARRPLDEGVRRFAAMRGRTPPQRQQERRHGERAERANAHMRGPPALGRHEMLHDRRPNRARDIVAAGDDGDGNAASTGEPLRGVGDQRPERGGGAEPDEDVYKRKQHEIGGEARGDVTDAERERAAYDRRRDAEPVGEPSHEHAAAGKPDHRQVKGSEASARATPNSACTAGSTTGTDHMPTLPLVPSITAAPSRSQAQRDSTPA